MKSKLLALFVFCLFVVLPLVTQAEEKSWHFDRWDVEIDINEDSSFVVKEKQTFNFKGDFSWVTRDIAKKDFYDISDIKVYDQDGNQLTGDQVEITHDYSYAYIRINFDLSDTSYNRSRHILVIP